MRVLKSIVDVRNYVREEHQAGRRVALVPTMGYLHEGHTSLMVKAQACADSVMASIFVNPTQFGPGEDLDTYPRDEDGDLEKAGRAGCAAVFLPSIEEMYPENSQTVIQPGPMADVLCGARRPGHFQGVCTVVLKLLNITGCDVACFGEKDFQQLAIIRRMVEDLDLSVEIISGSIIRENDGLAMSSRNVYLDDEARSQAPVLRQALLGAQERWLAGERRARPLVIQVKEMIETASRARIDYVHICDARSLIPWTELCGGPTVLAVAVHFDGTRLIDNIVLEPVN